MEHISKELDTLKSIIQCIARQFGSRCEVIIHDFEKGFDHTIVAIENGHVTGREIGGTITNIGLEDIQNPPGKERVSSYINKTKDRRTIRSTSSMIKNAKGKVIGAMCINFDISDFIKAEALLGEVTTPLATDHERIEHFTHTVGQLLDVYIAECIAAIGKPLTLMTKKDKIQAIGYLDSKGAFLITKAGEKVCDTFNISKFTLYNYLDHVRGKK